jgi:hypothetical protein
MAETFTPFPAFDVATRILVAVACGLLVGLERQWANLPIVYGQFRNRHLIWRLALLSGLMGLLGGGALALESLWPRFV